MALIIRIYRLLLFGLFFLPLNTTAQVAIQGRVVSESSGLPLEGSSVYFNNTSIGTSTNAEGRFSISLRDMDNAELIISSLGYQRLVYKPEATTIQNKTLVFKLAQKEEQLKEVLILTDAVRKKYLAIFEREFLGITEEASRSIIKNKKDIYFTKGEGKNVFNAYSDTALVIVNKMLGYTISFELVEFFYDEQSGRTSYYGYTRFEEMGDKNRWIKNRKHTYYGSTAHFYRALIANNLKKEGYQIYIIKPTHLSTDNSNNGDKNIITQSKTQQEMDVAVEVNANQVIAKDTTDSSNYIVTVPGKLMVQYGKDPSSKNYLSKITFIQGSLPVGFRSYVTSTSSFISLNNAGIANNPMDLQYAGYWIYEKAANMLPLNYTPD